jgi:Putative DNA-binding domain
MIDLFTADFNYLNNDQRYSAIVEFALAQPTESNRHDFKLLWTNDALKDVAAFANTFGGVLIVGVEKNQSDTQAKVVGVPSNSELTTGIASAIATNISPTPSYDIMECWNAGDANKRFCVVRVRSDSTLYLVTKKDISVPVWVRNADQTVRADAAQLRRMIDREKRAAGNVQGLSRRAHRLFEEMVIGRGYAADLTTWPTGTWQRSDTYFKAVLIPTERKTITLDGRDEGRFVNLIHNSYRRVRGTLGSASKDAPNRSADYYEYRWYHKNLDHEAVGV